MSFWKFYTSLDSSFDELYENVQIQSIWIRFEEFIMVTSFGQNLSVSELYVFALKRVFKYGNKIRTCYIMYYNVFVINTHQKNLSINKDLIHDEEKFKEQI